MSQSASLVPRPPQQHTIICCDMKSFYASVECVDRGLDPLSWNLVVADASRTDKTICLAVSPSLKALGVPGRPRLFEVIQKVDAINGERRCVAPRRTFAKESSYAPDLVDPACKVSYITAPPRMNRYMEVSTQIYAVFLRYLSPDDILVYSIDEAFLDVTNYLYAYQMDAHALAMKIIREVLSETGITATIGIGTNMYLAKVAMDIVAKRMPADPDGVRIAELDEMLYRRLLWSHRPITDFWRVGPGYARRLSRLGLVTMGDVARCSMGKPGEFYNEDILYKTFGVNAELLIDHAWGYESTTMTQAKAYRPKQHSLCSGQVLPGPYSTEKARLVAIEMADQLSLEMTAKGVVTDALTLYISFDATSMDTGYTGPTHIDHYGRTAPVHGVKTGGFDRFTASTRLMMELIGSLYDQIVPPGLYIRCISICAGRVITRQEADEQGMYRQMELFVDYDALERLEAKLEREARLQSAVVSLRGRYGKNVVLKAMDLLPDARTAQRNSEVGGHRAGKFGALTSEEILEQAETAKKSPETESRKKGRETPISTPKPLRNGGSLQRQTAVH